MLSRLSLKREMATPFRCHCFVKPNTGYTGLAGQCRLRGTLLRDADTIILLKERSHM